MSFPYPVFLSLAGKRCLVLGNGYGAEEKVLGLAGAGAVVVRRPDYEADCLAGYFLVIAATGDRALNARIAAEAERRGILFNAVDDPEHCGFILPAIHRQGDLVVAVSTGGKSPAVAVRLRNWIAAEVGPEYARLVEMLGGLREEIAAKLPDFEQRRRLWHRLAGSEALHLLRKGRPEEASSVVRSLVEGRSG
jgi:siroheme synthase-like protein